MCTIYCSHTGTYSNTITEHTKKMYEENDENGIQVWMKTNENMHNFLENVIFIFPKWQTNKKEREKKRKKIPDDSRNDHKLRPVKYRLMCGWFCSFTNCPIFHLSVTLPLGTTNSFSIIKHKTPNTELICSPLNLITPQIRIHSPHTQFNWFLFNFVGCYWCKIIFLYNSWHSQSISVLLFIFGKKFA